MLPVGVVVHACFCVTPLLRQSPNHAKSQLTDHSGLSRWTAAWDEYHAGEMSI